MWDEEKTAVKVFGGFGGHFFLLGKTLGGSGGGKYRGIIESRDTCQEIKVSAFVYVTLLYLAKDMTLGELSNQPTDLSPSYFRKCRNSEIRH